jgi:hypothetical protein
MNLPTHRVTPAARSLLLMTILATALSGCAGPSASADGIPAVQSEFYNASDRTVTVRLTVMEPHGGTVLHQEQHTLGPEDVTVTEPVHVAGGRAVLHAWADGLEREVRVDARDEANHYRFVLHDRVIAFQAR